MLKVALVLKLFYQTAYKQDFENENEFEYNANR